MPWRQIKDRGSSIGGKAGNSLKIIYIKEASKSKGVKGGKDSE